MKFSNERKTEHSFFNESEIKYFSIKSLLIFCRICSQLLDSFIKKLNSTNKELKHTIGCISPYKKQVVMLNEKLKEAHGFKFRDYVAVNTVDAFQV